MADDSSERIRVSFELNGDRRTVDVRADETVLEMLRWRYALSGAREGCGVGMCGACTVLVDGRSMSGCLVLAPQLEESRVETVEALEGSDGTLSPIQQAFVDHAAFQCAFCTPGFLMAATALLAETPRPTRQQVQDGLAGNLCRCGSYVNIVNAVLAAADRNATEPVGTAA
jgi:aerobic-type carbon monoxide dehydrogenase small subunit (CoxS/CutS family)